MVIVLVVCTNNSPFTSISSPALTISHCLALPPTPTYPFHTYLHTLNLSTTTTIHYAHFFASLLSPDSSSE